MKTNHQKAVIARLVHDYPTPTRRNSLINVYFKFGQRLSDAKNKKGIHYTYNSEKETYVLSSNIAFERACEYLNGTLDTVKALEDVKLEKMATTILKDEEQAEYLKNWKPNKVTQFFLTLFKS